MSSLKNFLSENSNLVLELIHNLDKLCTTKLYKDKFGDDEVYRSMKIGLWETANKNLEVYKNLKKEFFKNNEEK
ncbi:MAG: hypothetical protein PHT94_00915 [Candidatus Nanoarchaeia archaeon]|nr:hypothetical protein [Candidatus Nanoarchaeia archaeon]